MRLGLGVGIGGQGGAFSPVKLPDLWGWFDAGNVTLDGNGRVETWNLKAGSGSDITQSDSAKRPNYGTVNGEDTIQFNPNAVADTQHALPSAGPVGKPSFDKSFDVSGQDLSPREVSFGDSGAKMYMVGDNSDSVHQYTLSTPWDIGTSSLDKSFDVSAQDTSPQGVFLGDGGGKMYVVGVNSDSVHQYTLSTLWDIGTASFDKSFDVSAQDTIPTSVFLGDGGSKMYVMGEGNDSVHQYTLSTPWDTGTASFDKSFDISAQDSLPQGVFLGDSGGKMYVVGFIASQVFQYTLLTAWDIGTASFDKSFDVSAQDADPAGVVFSNTGERMYIMGNSTHNVHQYSLNKSWDLGANQTVTFVGQIVSGSGSFYEWATGAEIKVNNSEPDWRWANDESASEVQLVRSGPSFDKSFSVSGQETSPRGVFLGDGGSKLYVTGGGSDSVHQYTLSTPWDIGTASFDKSFDVSAQDTNPQGVFLGDGGNKMYVVGQGNNSVHQYTLSTPWDIGTASFDKSFDVSVQDSSPTGVVFSNAGERMYVVGLNSDSVHQYTLSTPWDIGTASFDKSFDVSGQDKKPEGVFLGDGGSKLYVMGNNSDSVHQYTLSTLWDIGTASLDKSFDVSGQDTALTGVFLGDNGSKMYVMGFSNKSVFQYQLINQWDISSGNFDALSLVYIDDTQAKVYINGQFVQDFNPADNNIQGSTPDFIADSGEADFDLRAFTVHEAVLSDAQIGQLHSFLR